MRSKARLEAMCSAFSEACPIPSLPIVKSDIQYEHVEYTRVGTRPAGTQAQAEHPGRKGGAWYGRAAAIRGGGSLTMPRELDDDDFVMDPEGDSSSYLSAMDLRPRSVSEEQMRTFERYMAEIFTAFGMDVHTPATKDTPYRFIKAL